MNIDTPSEDVQSRVKVFSDLVTDPSDRAKLAIFNYEFASRVLDYTASVQQVNDIYSLAGKTFFKGDLVDKYDNLAEEIVKLMERSLGKENHNLTQEEKQSVHDDFMGVAWSLIQRGSLCHQKILVKHYLVFLAKKDLKLKDLRSNQRVRWWQTFTVLRQKLL